VAGCSFTWSVARCRLLIPRQIPPHALHRPTLDSDGHLPVCTAGNRKRGQRQSLITTLAQGTPPCFFGADLYPSRQKWLLIRESANISNLGQGPTGLCHLGRGRAAAGTSRRLRSPVAHGPIFQPPSVSFTPLAERASLSPRHAYHHLLDPTTRQQPPFNDQLSLALRRRKGAIR